MAKRSMVQELLVGAIPQWYQAPFGPNDFMLDTSGVAPPFWSTRLLTPDLQSLHAWMRGRFDRWVAEYPSISTPSADAKVTEEVAVKWLNLRRPEVNWTKVLAFLDRLRLRTYENAPITKNVILAVGTTGLTDITADDLEKGLAGLAGSSQTYIKTDAELRYLEYGEVPWRDISEVTDYKFHPDFLHPIWSRIDGTEECSAHLTSRGDVVVMDSLGIVAANRRGRWFVYDVQTFKNFITDAFQNYRIGCNLFDIVFDLSYRRHGALLVYDPQHHVMGKITNKGSIIAPGSALADGLRATVRDVVSNISLERVRLDARKKRLFLEVASLDGAVVFDDTSILAFGAFVETHPGAPPVQGTRTVAAHSAFLWGSTVAKVSADGDITLLFKSRRDGRECDAATRFM